MPPLQVHVWHARLDVEPAVASTLGSLLSGDERDRAERFWFDRDRRRFVAARGLLRTILGGWLGLDPRGLRLVTGDHGKPRLADESGVEPVFFNVAHSGDHALFAVTDRRPVGVDIEVVRDVPSAVDIADRFFSPAESEAIRRLPGPQQSSAFFRCWTRKEAYVKALGSGLSHPLDAFEVTMTADEPARLRSVDGAGVELADWSLLDLSNLPVYAAAVAVQAREASVRLQSVNLDRLRAGRSAGFDS